MKRLVLAPKARADLFDIDTYIAERNPLAAERLIERLIQAMKILSQMPDGGVIFSDGIEADFVDFNSGTRATITIADRKGLLVI